MVSGGTKDFCDYFTLHNLHSVYFCYLIFIEPKFYWETRFFFTSFFEIRKFVKSLWAKFSTLQRERGHNFCFLGEIFTPDCHSTQRARSGGQGEVGHLSW